MTGSEQDEFVDRVAQAVIDRIEERERVTGLVEMVVKRVMQLQSEERQRKDAAVAEANNVTLSKSEEILAFERMSCQ